MKRLVNSRAGALAILITVASALPARAEPIVFSFVTSVSQVFGPVESLVGRTFSRGDTLTGRVILDFASLSPDLQPRTGQGRYAVGSGRIELDVPTRFGVSAGSVDEFVAIAEHNPPGLGLDHFTIDAFDQFTPGVGMVTMRVSFQDYTGRALSSDALPSSVAQFGKTEFRLNTLLNGVGITLYGDTAPIPEPGTMLLVGAGVAGIAARARRRQRGASR